MLERNLFFKTTVVNTLYISTTDGYIYTRVKIKNDKVGKLTGFYF